MNVSVGREFEQFVREKEQLFEARLQSLRGEIQKGIDQVERGEARDGEIVMADLRAKLLSRMR